MPGGEKGWEGGEEGEMEREREEGGVEREGEEGGVEREGEKGGVEREGRNEEWRGKGGKRSGEGRGGTRSGEGGEKGRHKVKWEQAKTLRSLLGGLVHSPCAPHSLVNKVQFLGLILKKW